MATPTPVFPGAIATDQQLKVANNLITTTVKVAIGATDTILFVNATAGFVANGLISIDNEIIAISSVVASPNAQLIVAAGGRGFDGTTAATHSAGAKVSMFIDAWHHNALATEIKAVEAFLGPNGQNFAGLAGDDIRTSTYDFQPQSPGGSLIVGNNVITLTPVPGGVNGSDLKHYLYISGGTGAAEAVLITGGTAVAGAASGTVIVNCANAHSGAWTIQSAANGLQEAIQVAIASGVPKTVLVTANITAHAQTSLDYLSAPMILDGKWHNISRAADYLNGNLISAINPYQDQNIYRLTITNEVGTNVITGAAILSQSTPASTGQTGWLRTRDVHISGGQYGIRAINQTVDLENTIVYMYSTSYKPTAGISLEGLYSSPMRPSSNNNLANCMVFSGSPDGTDPNIVTYGLLINGVDGLTGVNLLIQGDYALALLTTNNNYNDLLYFDQIFTDHARSACVMFGGDGTGSTHLVSIANSHFAGANNGNGIDVGHTTNGNYHDIAILNCDVEINNQHGIALGPGYNYTVQNNRCFANNVGNTANQAGIYLDNTTGGLLVTGNKCANESSIGPGHQKWGFLAGFGFSGDNVIANNAFGGNETGPASFGGTYAAVVRGNAGIDDTIVSVADAASITWPVNPNFVITGTGTAISSAVMTAVSGGATGTLRTVNGPITFTAGGTFGNSLTTVQNVPVVWIWDGSNVWLK